MIYTGIFIAIPFVIATQIPSNSRVDKSNVIYFHNEILYTARWEWSTLHTSYSQKQMMSEKSQIRESTYDTIPFI